MGNSLLPQKIAGWGNYIFRVGPKGWRPQERQIPWGQKATLAGEIFGVQGHYLTGLCPAVVPLPFNNKRIPGVATQGDLWVGTHGGSGNTFGVLAHGGGGHTHKGSDTTRGGRNLGTQGKPGDNNFFYPGGGGPQGGPPLQGGTTIR